MKRFLHHLSTFIFFSRWLQAPLYVGLVLTLVIYVYDFGAHLIALVLEINRLDSTQIMMSVLDLIDVVMIANLLIMVIIGGFEIFVSRLNIKEHPDHPEWLDEVNAGTMKVKLATALISISSIHLLKTFFDMDKLTSNQIMWQVFIHLTLVGSAIAIAYTNNLLDKGHKPKKVTHNKSLEA